MLLPRFPLAYFITFTTYGTRLPGRESGWVNCCQNRYRTPYPVANAPLEHKIKSMLRQQTFHLDSLQRPLVLAAIQEACAHRGWNLQAAHVRNDHVHSVIEAAAEPDFVTNTLKSYSSRKLNEAGFDFRGRRRWTRGESKIYLWTTKTVESATAYVLEGQGEPMTIYRKPAL